MNVPNPKSCAAPRALVLLAFAAIYFFWGSCYLANRFVLETLPPSLAMGLRNLAGGVLMYGVLRARGVPAPSRRQWGSEIVLGALLIVGGQAATVWAQQYIASGLAALLAAMTPAWMVLLGWWLPGGTRPRRGILAGLVVGLTGMYLLVRSSGPIAGTGVHPWGIVLMAASTICWSFGSLYTRRANLPASSLLTTAGEMLTGGVILLWIGLFTGEASAVRLGAISARSLWALGYLTIFCGIIAYTAYTWLLRVSTTSRVSSYAYVNPLVAVFLGWAFAGEHVTGQTLFCTILIIAGVVLLTAYQTSPAAKKAPATLAVTCEEDPDWHHGNGDAIPGGRAGHEAARESDGRIKPLTPTGSHAGKRPSPPGATPASRIR